MADTELILMIERCAAGLANHPGGDALGEKIGPAKIGRDHLIEAFLAGFEHIGPDARRDPSVVDQNIQPAKLCFDGL